jgi:hypothetical protein
LDQLDQYRATTTIATTGNEVSGFTIGVSPRSGEVSQRQLSSFVGIFGSLREAATYRIGLRPGSDGFAFELIRKRDQSALYFGVPGHPSQSAALCHFIA